MKNAARVVTMKYIDTEYLDSLHVRLNKLETWLEGDARCPCCQELKKCSDSCTFERDDCDGYERMMEVRKVLYDD